MYTEFYNLKEKPFTLTHSSKYLYLGDTHKEALALLTYGVIERMGFILLTGEVGTGKTTMVHALLGNLGKDVQYVYISNPLFSVNDFMDYLAFSVFKKKIHFQSKTDFLIQFEAFLKEQLRNQKNFILIIDEAQKLSFELLEEIRLLSNMETADEKLINIFLVGQPELNETLSRVECRPLLQRISIRYHIKALDVKDTGEYINTRLKMAGAEEGNRIFTNNTIKEIYKYSQGYPRMINILADNILLLGYSRGIKRPTPDMVKECYNDMQLFYSFFGKQEKKGPPAVPVEKPAPQKNPGQKWVFIIFPALLIIALLIGVYATPLFRQIREQEVVFKEKNELHEIIKDEEVAPQKSDDAVNAGPREQENSKEEKSLNNSPENLQSEIDIPEDIDEQQDKILTANQGETLTDLAIYAYGYANDRVLNFIKEHNPEIADINIIKTGQAIRFPPLGSVESEGLYTVHIASFNPFENARELFNELIMKGYEAYIVPVYDQNGKKMYRVTLGSFEDKEKANIYAEEILNNKISDYANVLKLDIR